MGIWAILLKEACALGYKRGEVMHFNKGWWEGAEHCPSPNFNARPPATCVNLVVLHNISLPPDQFGSGDVIDFFQNKLDVNKHPYYRTIQDMRVSAHFFIERTGRVIQCVSIEDRAWHAGVSSFQSVENCNDYSIGIELEGCDTQPFTEAQYTALTHLLETLKSAYPAITQERIVGHDEVALPRGRKTDPGPYFEWQRVR
jgi:AmpD protein